MRGKIENEKLKPKNNQQWQQTLQSLNGKEVTIDIKKHKNTRTQRQNRAMHKLFRELSQQMNEQGLTLQQVLRTDVETMMTPKLVKEVIWRPVQKAMYGKESTTQLTTDEVDKVFDVINKHLGKHGIHVPFPSIETLMEE